LDAGSEFFYLRSVLSLNLLKTFIISSLHVCVEDIFVFLQTLNDAFKAKSLCFEWIIAQLELRFQLPNLIVRLVE